MSATTFLLMDTALRCALPLEIRRILGEHQGLPLRELERMADELRALPPLSPTTLRAMHPMNSLLIFVDAIGQEFQAARDSAIAAQRMARSGLSPTIGSRALLPIKFMLRRLLGSPISPDGLVQASDERQLRAEAVEAIAKALPELGLAVTATPFAGWSREARDHLLALAARVLCEEVDAEPRLLRWDSAPLLQQLAQSSVERAAAWLNARPLTKREVDQRLGRLVELRAPGPGLVAQWRGWYNDRSQALESRRRAVDHLFAGHPITLEWWRPGPPRGRYAPTLVEFIAELVVSPKDIGLRP